MMKISKYTLTLLVTLLVGGVNSIAQTRLTQDFDLEIDLVRTTLIHSPLTPDISRSFEAEGLKKTSSTANQLLHRKASQGGHMQGGEKYPTHMKRAYPATEA